MIRIKYKGDGGWIAHPKGLKAPPAADFVVVTPDEALEDLKREADDQILRGLYVRVAENPESYAAPLVETELYDRVAACKSKE